MRKRGENFQKTRFFPKKKERKKYRRKISRCCQNFEEWWCNGKYR